MYELVLIWSISCALVCILLLYAIIFSLHAILNASLIHGLPRGQDSELLPVLFFQLLYQWVVDLGVHGCQNTFVRDRAIQYLFDSCESQYVSHSPFRNRMRIETPFVN